MGTLPDTTVFIELERALRRLPAPGAMNQVSGRLEEQLGSTEEVGIAAITASELDTLLLRLHTETACRRGGALALRPADLDAEQCLVLLREKGETTHWQPVSPTLMARLVEHGRERHAPWDGQLLRYADGRPITYRRYDHLWKRIGGQLPWVATQQVTTHWIRHTTLTWVKRNFGYATARAYAGHHGTSGDAGATSTYVRASVHEVAADLAALSPSPPRKAVISVAEHRRQEPGQDGHSRPAGRQDGRASRSWPLFLLAVPAAIAVWSGWVRLGQMTGFGMVRPFPGLWDTFQVNTAITLPIGVEAYGVYALGTWLSSGTRTSMRTRRYAMWSAIGSILLGMAGQVAYHLMSEARITRAPWGITTGVACLPVLLLGMAAALAHMRHADASGQEHDEAGKPECGSPSR
ncbi:MAG: tyrosine-type recombinase/integrase [Streptosporangiaceae bacterium]